MTAAAAWLYALVSGLSAPVVRAAGGFSLFLFARFLFRRTRIMNLLAAVALAYLMWDPSQLFDASFQLSFLCVAAIGALASPLLEIESGRWRGGCWTCRTSARSTPIWSLRVAQARVELRLAAETLQLWSRLAHTLAGARHRAGLAPDCLCSLEMALISTVIQIGLALPMAEYFHRVSFTGLTANLLIVPLLNAVVPLGFVAIFTGWRWVAALAGWLLHISARIADWHAGIEPSWRVPDPPVWLALSFAASLILLARAFAPASLSRRPAAAVVLVLFVLLVWHPWPPQVQPRVLELTSIDVGQGDSLLLVFPGGARMLVDGGGLLQFGQDQEIQPGYRRGRGLAVFVEPRNQELGRGGGHPRA